MEVYFLIGLLALNFFLFYFFKVIKIFLFKKRKNIFLKLLYSRVEKIGVPFLLLIDVNALHYLFGFNEKVIFFINVFLVSWLVYEIIKYFIYTSINVKIARKENVRRELFSLSINLAKILILIIDVTIILSYLGINITAIITSLGVGGLIVGLGAKDTLSNFFDSIRLVSEDAFHVGDWIETRDFEGFVTEIGLNATQIRTFDNALITIPNSRLANDYIKNWSRRVVGRRIKFWVKLKYSTDTKEIEKVIKKIKEMLINHPKIVTDEKIKNSLKKMPKNALFVIEDKYGVRKTLLVYLDKFDDYSMDILVYAFSTTVKWDEWLKVKQEVLMRVLEIIENSKLELAYPTSVVFYDKKENLWKS